jgi:hypothetical protein
MTKSITICALVGLICLFTRCRTAAELACRISPHCEGRFRNRGKPFTTWRPSGRQISNAYSDVSNRK